MLVANFKIFANEQDITETHKPKTGFSFLGVNIKGGSAFGVGLRFAHFFKTEKTFKLGFITDTDYESHFLPHNKLIGLHSPRFISLDLKFAFKIKWFYFSAGPYISYRISKEDYIEQRYDNGDVYMKRWDFGISCSIGWMKDVGKVKLFFGFTTKVGLVGNFYRSLIRDDRDQGTLFFAAELGLGF